MFKELEVSIYPVENYSRIWRVVRSESQLTIWKQKEVFSVVYRIYYKRP